MAENHNKKHVQLTPFIQKTPKTGDKSDYIYSQDQVDDLLEPKANKYTTSDGLTTYDVEDTVNLIQEHTFNMPVTAPPNTSNSPHVTPEERIYWNDKEEFIAAGTINDYLRGDKNWAILNKATVGLDKVDNTADVEKPISGPQQDGLLARDQNVASIAYYTTQAQAQAASQNDPKRLCMYDGGVYFNGRQMFASNIDIHFPIGSVYVQYADDVTGQFITMEQPDQLYGGTWRQMYAGQGVFFRTDGIDDNRNAQTGIQGDRIRNIAGGFGRGDLAISTVAYGAFNLAIADSRTVSYTINSSSTYRDVQLNAAAVVPVGADNAPKNALMKVWKRTA